MLKRLSCVMVVLLLVAVAQSEEVYKSDFQDGASADVWTFTNCYKIPGTEETVLGRILYQNSTRMHLEDLPDHVMVRLRLDLLLFGEFAGYAGEKTYNGFSIGTQGGPLLFATNLSTRQAGAEHLQCFPDEYPGAVHPAQTGLVGKDGQHRYQLDMTFPHNGEVLDLFFRGRVHDKQSGWGFANVRVDVLDKPNDLAADRGTELWKALGGDDPMVAHRATWELIGSGKAGLQLVEKQFVEELARRNKIAEGKAAAAGKAFAAAVKLLASDDFVERQQASATISKLGSDALPLIKKALAAKPKDAEMRRRLKQLESRLKKKRGVIDPKHRRLDSRVAHIRRVLDQSRAGWRVSSSRDEDENGWDGAKAVIDGHAPPRSRTIICPRFSWFPKSVGNGWLRIDFPKAKEISKIGVFWFFAGWGTEAPAAWHVDYLDADGKTWKPVVKPGAFGVAPDKFNEVKFDPVRTKAVRITATFNGKKSTGILEVTVE